MRPCKPQRAGRQTSSGRVFVLGADGQPRRTTCGWASATARRPNCSSSPGAAEALKEGTEVITAVISSANGAAPAARKAAPPRMF